MFGKATPEEMIVMRKMVGFINVASAARDLDPFSSDETKVQRTVQAIQILFGEAPDEPMHPLDIETVKDFVISDREGTLRPINHDLK